MWLLDWLPGNWTLAIVACVLVALWCLARSRPKPTLEELKSRVCKDPEVLGSIGNVRSTYSLSKRGFLPAEVCERLPSAYEEWEALVRQLPELNRQGKLRRAVDDLPELPMQELFSSGEAALQRAYLILGMLAHSYVHGPNVPWHRLEKGSGGADSKAEAAAPAPAAAVPPQLARPWFAACCVLRMPPVLTAGAVDLWNWRLRDKDEAFKPENLRLTVSMTGTDTEANFHMVPCSMQAAAGRVLPKIFLADILVRGQRYLQLAALLRELADVLREFKEIFGYVAKGVDRDVFYDVYRPLLNGFFPEGIVLQGLDVPTAKVAAPFLDIQAGGPGAIAVRSKGPSAGQSTMMLLFDHFLGIDHGSIGASFQEEMLDYMPEPHGRMVRDYRERWKGTERLLDHVRRIRMRGPIEMTVAQAFTECVKELRDLRRFHLTTVQRYLSRTNTGTGASTWRRLLQGTLVATQASSLGGWGTVAEALKGQIPTVDSNGTASEEADEEKVDAGQAPELPREEATVAGRLISRETPEPEHMPEELKRTLGYPSFFNIAKLYWTINSNKPGSHFKIRFPHTVEQLKSFGAAWLTQAFHLAGTLPADNEVKSIVSVRAFSGGGAASKAVMTVEYAKASPDLHTELFVKMSLSSSEKNRLFCLFLAMEGKECIFNRYFAHRVPFYVPKFYFADISMVTTNWILISESLPFADESQRGKRLDPYVLEPPVRKGMDWSMPDMADKYYALFRKAAMLTAWAHTGKLGDQITEWFPKNFPMKVMGFPLSTVEQKLYPLLEEFVLSRATRLFPPEVADVAYMAQFKQELMAVGPAVGWMFRFVMSDDSLWGYMHVNLHIDNGFFWRDEEGRQDCGLLDWGGATIGYLPTVFYGPGGALSMASHEVRIAHTAGLVQHFVDSLQEFGGPSLDPEGLLLRACLLDMMSFFLVLGTIEKGGFGGIYERLPREKWKDVTGIEDPVFTDDSLETMMLRCSVMNLREGLLTWRGRRYHEMFKSWKTGYEEAALAAAGKTKEQ